MFFSTPLVLSLLLSLVLACSPLNSLLSSSQADMELQSICYQMSRMSTCKSCPRTNGKWTCEPYKAYNDLCDEMPDMSQCATWLKSCEGIKARGGSTQIPAPSGQSTTPSGQVATKSSESAKPTGSAVWHDHGKPPSGQSTTQSGQVATKSSEFVKPTASSVGHYHAEHACGPHSAPTGSMPAAATVTAAASSATPTSAKASGQPSKIPILKSGAVLTTPIQSSVAFGLLSGLLASLFSLV